MTEQMHLVLRNYGKIDPTKIEDYISRDGYEALQKALGMRSEDIINEVKRSNLRGRRGAGFNCGFKWEFAYKAKL